MQSFPSLTLADCPTPKYCWMAFNVMAVLQEAILQQVFLCPVWENVKEESS